MDIVLIGSGNTATVLGRKALDAGHRILQVFSRQESHARWLSDQLGAEPLHVVSRLNKRADLMIIALRDDVIGSFLEDMGETRSVLIHTAGAISIRALHSHAGRYGVIYPLQSLRKEIRDLPPLTLLVDGNETATSTVLKDFSSTIAENVLEAGDEDRLKYHLAGTLVNNFTNHLFALTDTFCKKENISFAVLQPLLEETVARLRETSPADAQTGPALRNDLKTLQKHRDLLKPYPDLLRLYELFTEEIQRHAKSGYPE